jgi:hypothetical protein
MVLQVGSQKYKRCFQKITFIFLAWSQISLNLPLDNCHFGYNKKIARKKTLLVNDQHTFSWDVVSEYCLHSEGTNYYCYKISAT